MNTGTLNRLAAFTNNPEGGNPAGVWIGDTLPEPDKMQRIAAEVGYSETDVEQNMKLYSAWLALRQQEIEVKFIEHQNESRTHDFRSLTNSDAL